MLNKDLPPKTLRLVGKLKNPKRHPRLNKLSLKKSKLNQKKPRRPLILLRQKKLKLK